MIVVRFELWPEGDESKRKELATMAIENLRHDLSDGDYAYSISHQDSPTNKAADKRYERDPHKLLKLLDKDGKKTGVPVWKHGIILGFERSQGVVKLVWHCLVKSFGDYRFGA